MPEKKGYVVNLKTGKLHKSPTRERCNMDQAEKKRLFERQDDAEECSSSECAYCFGDDEE